MEQHSRYEIQSTLLAVNQKLNTGCDQTKQFLGSTHMQGVICRESIIKTQVWKAYVNLTRSRFPTTQMQWKNNLLAL